MKIDNFFEKEVELLQNFCKGYEMYDTEMCTVSDTTVVANVWYGTGKIQRVLVDIKNEKVFVLDSFFEERKEFLTRLVG